MTVGIMEWMLIGVVVVLFFGRGKVSELMGDVAKGIKSFKKGLAEDDEAAKKEEPPKAVEAAPKPLHQTGTEANKAGWGAKG